MESESLITDQSKLMSACQNFGFPPDRKLISVKFRCGNGNVLLLLLRLTKLQNKCVKGRELDRKQSLK